MSSEPTHHFSDSEEEHEEEEEEPSVVAFDEEVDLIETVSKNFHETTVSELRQALSSLKLEHASELDSVLASKRDMVALYQKERSDHLDEMTKRQLRINFLVDRMISK